jgi:hypothetical protein
MQPGTVVAQQLVGRPSRYSDFEPYLSTVGRPVYPLAGISYRIVELWQLRLNSAFEQSRQHFSGGPNGARNAGPAAQPERPAV